MTFRLAILSVLAATGALIFAHSSHPEPSTLSLAVPFDLTAPQSNEVDLQSPITTMTTEPYVAPAPSPPPQPRPSVARPPASGSGACGNDWDCFRECTIDHESRFSGTYATNTGNGYYGAFQFVQSTWDNAVNGAGYPEWVGRHANEAPPEIQDAAARWLWERAGTGPWGGRCG